jgi:hypothetical protein
MSNHFSAVFLQPAHDSPDSQFYVPDPQRDGQTGSQFQWQGEEYCQVQHACHITYFLDWPFCYRLHSTSVILTQTATLHFGPFTWQLHFKHKAKAFKFILQFHVYDLLRFSTTLKRCIRILLKHNKAKIIKDCVVIKSHILSRWYSQDYMGNVQKTLSKNA